MIKEYVEQRNGAHIVGRRRREPAVDILSAPEGSVIGVPDPEVLDAAESALLNGAATNASEWAERTGFVPI